MGRPDQKLTLRSTTRMSARSTRDAQGPWKRMALPAVAWTALTTGCHRMESPAVPTNDNGPNASIVAPQRVHAGDLVILDASASTAKDFAWALCGSDKTYLPVDGGRRCVFSSGTPGRFHFVLAVGAADRVALAQHVIEVENTSPPEPDDPTVPDAPDLPHGKFGLAQLARDWVLETTPASPSRHATAQSLAGSFRSLAAAIAAGTLTQPGMILEATRTSNRDALAANVETWKPWSDKLARELETLHQQGSLSTANDFQAAWEEIAQGLSSL